VIPDLDRFPASWLADAELSLAIGRPERVGLSFFSTDAATFEAFTEQIGLSPETRADEKRLRARFDLGPRHWVKLHYVAGRPDGCSQYFAVHQRNHNPITTLRLFARQFGARDVTRLEGMLAAALEREDTSWIVILKRRTPVAEPRLSCRVPRALVPALVEAVATEGRLEPERAARYLEWDRRVQAGDAAWVTIDPLHGELCGLDFEDPDRGSLPDGWDEVPAGIAARPPRYLKCRLQPGESRAEWVIYLPAR
jgi:hypothetical protein